MRGFTLFRSYIKKKLHFIALLLVDKMMCKMSKGTKKQNNCGSYILSK